VLVFSGVEAPMKSKKASNDGQYLVIKGARAEEAQKEVESWLRKYRCLSEARWSACRSNLKQALPFHSRISRAKQRMSRWLK
jgi:hypothetical protein